MRKLTVADYFVEFLIKNKVTDVFGYQGGMIAYIFDSLGRYKDKIRYHSCGNEQGAALAACSYAQSSGKLGVAISTSGPGFTNLITGIANAWFDSVPVLFLSGNVNTKDKKRSSNFRQNGFQEIQATAMVKPITKKSIEAELNMDYIEMFDDAIRTAFSDRMGPVYIDLPINICREYVEFEKIIPYSREKNSHYEVKQIIDSLINAKRPCIIAGAGIKHVYQVENFRKLVNLLKIPVLTTMPAVDLLPSSNKFMMGYIGGTGRREAGIVLQNADVVLTLGTRLCSKQVGHNMSIFAPKAKIIYRTDVDVFEFERHLKDNEIDLTINLRTFIEDCISYIQTNKITFKNNVWSENCEKMHSIMSNIDMTYANRMIKDITQKLPSESNLIFDVGKNLTYCTQSSIIKENTNVYMSAGLGTMGYALPAAIGISYCSSKHIYVFSGDGGAQMNIQELNTIAKNKLPIKIFILNNKALGNIKIFQDNYLESRHIATDENEGDYFSCQFVDIANAYGIDGVKIQNLDELNAYNDRLIDDKPFLVEIEYTDCPSLPGIVAGGEYLNENSGINNDTIIKIKKLMEC